MENSNAALSHWLLC